jgi:hypothetical protein
VHHIGFTILILLGCNFYVAKDHSAFIFRIMDFSPLGLLNRMMKHYRPTECCELHSQRHSFTPQWHSYDNLQLHMQHFHNWTTIKCPIMWCCFLLHFERIQIIAVPDINIVMPVRNVSSSKPINTIAIPNPVCNLQHNSEMRKMIEAYAQRKISVLFNVLMSSNLQATSASFWRTLWIHKTGNATGNADKY